VTAQGTGLLPPPHTLAGFDDAVKGGAERVLRMPEKGQAYRIAYERAELDATRNDFRRGQIIGATLAISCVVASVYSVHIGAHAAASVALVGIPITALIGKKRIENHRFVRRKNTNRRITIKPLR